ncbi:MAG: ankyrin repeat domain-containing protein, partial [Gammaproteobacteria bacterium]
VSLDQQNYLNLVEKLRIERPQQWECFALLKQQAEVIHIKSLEETKILTTKIVNASCNREFEKIPPLLNEINTYCKNDILFHLARLKNFRDRHHYVIELLIKNNADINYKHPQLKTTALHIAATNNNIELTKELLDYHADIEARNQDGATPLIACANKEDNAEAVYTLTKYRANLYASMNINDKTNAGFNALHTAAKANCVNNVKILIMCRANPNKPDFFNRTPKELATSKEIITVLNQAEKNFVCSPSDYYANLPKVANPIGKLIYENDLIQIKILITSNQLSREQIEMGIITAIDEVFDSVLNIFNTLLPQEIFREILQKNLAEFTKKPIEMNIKNEKKITLIKKYLTNSVQHVPSTISFLKSPDTTKLNITLGENAISTASNKFT